MKKMISCVLVAVMALAFAGCNQQQQENSQNDETIKESTSDTEEKVYYYEDKAYKASELSDQTIEWLELDEMEQAANSYFPPKFAADSEMIDLEDALDSSRPK